LISRSHKLGGPRGIKNESGAGRMEIKMEELKKAAKEAKEKSY